MRRLVIIVCFALLVASCSSTPDVVTSESSGSSVTTENTSTMESIPDGTTESFVERTQEYIDAAWDSRLDYNGSGLDEIPDLALESIRYDYGLISDVTVENDSSYNGLAASIEEYEEGLMETDYPSVESDALSEQVMRCDNRIVCIRSYVQVTSGYRIEYITWDHAGEVLRFSDVITDYDLFIDTVSPLILESLGDLDEDVVDEIMSTLINASESQDFVFYMTNDSLSFFVEYCYSDEEGTLVNDSVEVTIPYREYADLFDPQYLPGNGAMIWEDPIAIRDLNSICLSDEYYNSLIGGTFVSYNGHDYAVIKVGSSMVDALAEGESESGESFSYEDYDPPIIAVVDLESNEIVYSEQSSWAELYDHRSLNPFGNCSDAIAFVADHV
ncbi:hypothetical protein SAMN06296952_1086 [Oscillospiraceae bacterium]|nr:hypothetical protein SAMN06296952_1086 [Oscillospiraceae bacterium]